MMFRFLFYFFLLDLSISNAYGNLANRNILDIDKSIYTHRDLLVWSLANQGLFYRMDLEISLPTAKSWEQITEEFRDEMIISRHIDTDSDRYASFIPNSDMVDEAYKIVVKNSRDVSGLKNFKLQYSITPAEIKNQLASILKVQRYLQNKSFSNNKKAWRFYIEKDSLWFERLMSSIPYRFFDGGNTYKEIKGL